MHTRLAQLVERKTLNLVVVGSSPTVGAFFVFVTSAFRFCKRCACGEAKKILITEARKKTPRPGIEPGASA